MASKRKKERHMPFGTYLHVNGSKDGCKYVWQVIFNPTVSINGEREA